jgi:Zn ribbon nucleic-acid-binding protein
MASDIRCPTCGEHDDLVGRRVDDLIEIECGSCGFAWQRDPTASCPRCGGKDLLSVPRSVVEKVRGDQTAVVGYVQVPLCRACDAEAVARSLRSRAPLPPESMPVTSRSNWGGATRPEDPDR